jgi:hypothetical protein
MFLDRVFGLSAAAAFALGVVSQAALLGNNAETSPFVEVQLVFWALALLPFVYMGLYVGARDGLPYDNSELEFMPVIKALTPALRTISYALLGYALLLFLLMALLKVPTPLATEIEAALGTTPIGRHLTANAILISLISMFTAISFATAAYLLRPRTR